MKKKLSIILLAGMLLLNIPAVIDSSAYGYFFGAVMYCCCEGSEGNCAGGYCRDDENCEEPYPDLNNVGICDSHLSGSCKGPGGVEPFDEDYCMETEECSS